MQTGENDQALRAAIDLIRKASVVLLGLHFYFFCYAAFKEWGLSLPIIEKVLLGFAKTGVFANLYFSKLLIMGLLGLSLVGSKGKKDEKIRVAAIITFIALGLVLYWSSSLLFYLHLPTVVMACFYMAVTSAGFISMLTGGARLSRLIKLSMRQDIFNEANESFPQEERLLKNPFSFNVPGIYKYKGKQRKMWVNVVSPARGVLLAGSPGAGKTYFFVRHIITQGIQNGHSLFCYDFKYDDLTRVVYNALLKYKGNYKKVPRFCVINFDDLSRSHRCNPLDPRMMEDITDAGEASRSILIGLNKEWSKKIGDFWVESPINFVTAVIWFLRQYENGRYCTLPHVIELMQADYESLFPVLGSLPGGDCDVLINPFIQAYLNRANEQLEGQIASAKIGMARLSSPQLYYVLSGDDFSLDINNPDDPKILCMGNNPLKIQTYGAVLSLYTNRMLKLVNQKGKMPCDLIFEEYPTIYQPLDVTVSTGRQNLVQTYIILQSLEQLRKDYSREQADVLINVCGNIIAGQSSGDTAKIVSERIGKIVQERESVSINRTDTSVSRNTQLDYAVPASRISNLSSGEFVGVVADTPDTPIKLKIFHCHIINDHAALKAEEDAYEPLPVFREVTPMEEKNNYIRIKNEVAMIIHKNLERIKNDPSLAHLLFEKSS